MAVDRPFGFEPYRADGKEVRKGHYTKKTGNAIYKGDVVQLASTGDVDVSAATGAVLGVAAEYRAATYTGKIAIYDDPNAEFIAQYSGTFAAADVGQNANIAAGSGNSTLRTSGHAIDDATKNTTSTLQVKLLGLLERGDNAVGANALVRCKLNNHVKAAGTTGV